MMQAATEGALAAGGAVGGIRISREAGTTVRTAGVSYLPEGTAVHCRFLAPRKVALVDAAVRAREEDRTAYIYLPGGLGTMDELFELLTLAQLGKLGSKLPVPIVLCKCVPARCAGGAGVGECSVGACDWGMDATERRGLRSPVPAHETQPPRPDTTHPPFSPRSYDGFYTPLMSWLKACDDNGVLRGSELGQLVLADDNEGVLDVLAAHYHLPRRAGGRNNVHTASDWIAAGDGGPE